MTTIIDRLKNTVYKIDNFDAAIKIARDTGRRFSFEPYPIEWGGAGIITIEER